MLVKDVRPYLDEARTLGVPVEIAEAVARLWDEHAERRGRRLRFHVRRRHCRQLRKVRMVLSLVKNSTTRIGSIVATIRCD